MRGEAALFAGELESYLIDPHGSGLSTPPADPSQYSPAGHAAFYEEVRQALGLDQVVLVGHSFGATTAWTYAALFPEAVAACIGMGGLGVARDAEAGRDAAVEEDYERLLARHAHTDWYCGARQALDTWHERVLATEDPQEIGRQMAALLPLYTAHPDHPEVAAGLAALEEWWVPDLACLEAWERGMYGTFDIRPLLGKIACPTLVVAGAMDFIGGPAQAVPIAEGIPGARLEVIPDCGHLPAVEAPDAYCAAVIRFLRS